VSRLTASTDQRWQINATKFQSLDLAEPAVFLITLEAGSVGMTLTVRTIHCFRGEILDPVLSLFLDKAASHVFLLEQAAGRIQRLGQKRPVGASKYVFENSCESRILKVHEKLQSGELEYTSDMLSSSAITVLLRNSW
jgi:SNF2 family DNA or RNA helicase